MGGSRLMHTGTLINVVANIAQHTTLYSMDFSLYSKGKTPLTYINYCVSEMILFTMYKYSSNETLLS